MNLKKLLSPAALPYNYQEWKKLPFPERVKQVCQCWALQGFGAPAGSAVFYVLKIILYVLLWFYFCSFSTDLGSMSTVGTWWFNVEALGKAILWTSLLEVLGLGGACGPLTARYAPPFGGITYFLRPNTIKAPLFPKIPFLGSDNRSFLDVLLYLSLLYFFIAACIAPQITPAVVLPILILIPILGILDKTIYLAARSDIYVPMMLCFLIPLETGSALKIVWFAVWFWAAFSKLTPNFTSVVCVMICNSPVFMFKIFEGLKKKLFRDFPNDLRPSSFANYMAHFGTVVEFAFPIILLLSVNYPAITFYALIVMSAFHFYIFMNLPMGVPLEWNVIMVFGAWVLFGFHPEFSAFEVTNPLITGVFVVLLFILPIIGNLHPRYVSFLLSMRYYAGTWPYSLWLYKGNAIEKVDQNIAKTSKSMMSQLGLFYDPDTSESVLSKMIAFRFMHLPGRLLHELLPKAVDNIDDYFWMDGELVAGEILGWNFGDGHLHNASLLASVQNKCNFESGELRVIMVESPQFHTQKLEWKIYDAKDGLLEKGWGSTRVLRGVKP